MPDPLRILHLEDDPLDVELIQGTLDAGGVQCEVRHVQNREQFETALTQDRFDLILSDYALPNYNGFAALEFARGKLPDIPFILLSGTLGEDVAVESLKTGATDYILKQRLDRLGPAVLRAVRDAQEHAEKTRAEQALRKSEAFTRSILQSALDCIIAMDHQGRIVEFNAAAEKTFGYNRAEAIGQEMAELIIPPAMRERHRRGLAHYIASGEGPALGKRLELSALRKGGAEFPVELTITRITGSEPPMFTGFLRDITERKRVEDALAQRAQIANLTADVGLALTQRESLADILQRCAECMVAHLGAAFARIWTLNDKDNVLELQVSAGMYTHIDGPHARVPVGKFKIGLIAQERKPHLTNQVVGDPRVPEQEWAKREGLISFAGYPLVVADRLVGVMAMFARQPLSNAILDGLKSIADAIALGIVRKRTEGALRQSEEKFRELADNIQEVFWITTADMTQVLYASAAYEKIWGRSIDHLYSNPQDWMDAILPEDRPQVIDTFTQLGQGLSEVSVEYRIRRPDDSVRWILDRGFPIRNEAGQTYRTGGIAKDITERKHLEEHLQQAQKMEAIGQLAGGIAHDFNNMLGCIMGYTELATLDPDATPGIKENLHDVIKASHRAKELVQQILTFSRQQEQQRSPIQLKPIIKEALKLLRASLPSTIQICADVDSETPSVLADATQIHQIVMNLATNAAHAMSRRQGQLGIKLSIMDVDAHFARSHPDLRAGRYVALAVSDTGCGMDRATLKRIFEPFFTTKPPGEGTGLGLSVVHGIMKTYEGAITVASEPGSGTTFHLYFPALKASTTEIARKPTAIPKGSGQRILFVDDEVPLSVLGKKMLERAGYSVTAHTSSSEALAAFRQAPAAYDLVITDFTMPTMTGVDLARELLNIRADLPIILATGFGGAMTPAKAGAIGIRELLLKPTNAQTLAEAAHRVLNVRKPR